MAEGEAGAGAQPNGIDGLKGGRRWWSLGCCSFLLQFRIDSAGNGLDVRDFGREASAIGVYVRPAVLASLGRSSLRRAPALDT